MILIQYGPPFPPHLELLHNQQWYGLVQSTCSTTSVAFPSSTMPWSGYSQPAPPHQCSISIINSGLVWANKVSLSCHIWVLNLHHRHICSLILHHQELFGPGKVPVRTVLHDFLINNITISNILPRSFGMHFNTCSTERSQGSGVITVRNSSSLCAVSDVEVLLYVHRNRRFIRDGSPGRPP